MHRVLDKKVSYLMNSFLHSATLEITKKKKKIVKNYQVVFLEALTVDLH